MPVFFGPSNLATEFVPRQVSSVAEEPGQPMPTVALAPTLICSCPFLFPNAEPDDRIARILHERVLEAARRHSMLWPYSSRVEPPVACHKKTWPSVFVSG